MSQPRSASQLSHPGGSTISGDTGVIRNEYGMRSRTASGPPNTMSSTSLSHGASPGVPNESWTCLPKAPKTSA